jgi:hypothetical protein
VVEEVERGRAHSGGFGGVPVGQGAGQVDEAVDQGRFRAGGPVGEVGVEEGLQAAGSEGAGEVEREVVLGAGAGVAGEGGGREVR